MTIPELRLLTVEGQPYAASVMLVPRGEEVQGLAFYYQIVTNGWSHWGYTSTYQRAWANVKRACKRHAERRTGLTKARE